LRAVLPLVALVLAVAIGVDILRGGGPAPEEVTDTLLAPQSLSGGVEATDCPAPCASSTPPPTSTPGPCPYCEQDPARWQQLTQVAPPELLGTSAALIEGECGELLLGKAWREQRQPASLAKIATAMVVVEHLDLAAVVDVQTTGWELVVENDSSIMGLIAGMRISVEELLYGLLLSSGNDAALELARLLGGEAAAVELMNQRVAALGLTDTRLQNTHGLDAPGAHTTPFDMAVLGREVLANPLLRQVVGTQFRAEAWHELGGLWNGNYLLYIYEDAVGVKTGYTEEAGWSIVSAAERDGRLLIASVFNSGDVYWDSMRLFDWAFENTRSAC
jgi:D-alanyl-D-alanine carboxypeptidase